MSQGCYERDNVSMSQSNTPTQHNIYKRSIAPFVAVSTRVSNRNPTHTFFNEKDVIKIYFIYLYFIYLYIYILYIYIFIYLYFIYKYICLITKNI